MSLRSWVYGIGLVLLILGVILILLLPAMIAEGILLVTLGAAALIGAYLFVWVKRHTMATTIIVVIFIVILFALLPFLTAAVSRLVPSAGATVKFPNASSGAGTNCAAADLGSWSSREQAFTDDNPNDDSKSAVATDGPASAACDDWNGFQFALDSTPVNRVQVTIEYRVASGTAQIRVAPFTASNATKCTAQSTTIQNGPMGSYVTDTFDFTSCKSWTPSDFNNNGIGVTIESVLLQLPSTVYLDYVKVTVQQSGQQGLAPSGPTISAADRALLTLILGGIALVAAVGALLMWLLRIRRRLIRYALLVAIFAGLGWFLLAYVIR